MFDKDALGLIDLPIARECLSPLQEIPYFRDSMKVLLDLETEEAESTYDMFKPEWETEIEKHEGRMKKAIKSMKKQRGAGKLEYGVFLKLVMNGMRLNGWYFDF